MKKLLSSIASIATAVLTFIFLSLPCSVVSSEIIGKGSSSSGWELLKNADSFKNPITGEYMVDGYATFRTFAIIGIVVACILLIAGLITLLQQFKVIKTKFNFCLINSIILAVYTVIAIVIMIALITFSGTFTVGSALTGSVGIGAILMVIVGVIATILSFVCSFSKK